MSEILQKRGRGRPPLNKPNAEAVNQPVSTETLVDTEEDPTGTKSLSQDKPVKTVRASKPWEKKDGVSNKPWRRDMFKLTSTRPGFWNRFVNPTKLERWIDKGYDIADPAHYSGLADRVIDDGSPLGKRIIRHGMVLMEIPNEGRKWYQEQLEKRNKAGHRDSKALVRQEAQRLLKQHGIDAKISEETPGKFEVTPT